MKKALKMIWYYEFQLLNVMVDYFLHDLIMSPNVGDSYMNCCAVRSF